MRLCPANGVLLPVASVAIEAKDNAGKRNKDSESVSRFYVEARVPIERISLDVHGYR